VLLGVLFSESLVALYRKDIPFTLVFFGFLCKIPLLEVFIMKSESELCTACPLKDGCDQHFIPERADGRRIVVSNPWQCRHITCQQRTDLIKKDLRNPKTRIIVDGCFYFKSPDKEHIRRVNVETGMIESEQDGEWYPTSQSIHRSYIVDPQYYPWKRIRPPKVDS